MSEGIHITGEINSQVDGAGDFNGDGFADIVVGETDAAGHATREAYVVFGHAGVFGATVDVADLDGETGFTLTGFARAPHVNVAFAGDINGDGFAGLVASGFLAKGDASYSGVVYVLFGKADGFAARIDVTQLDGSDGFRLDGAGVNDLAGYSIASAGDVNGDGLDDLLIGGHDETISSTAACPTPPSSAAAPRPTSIWSAATSAASSSRAAAPTLCGATTAPTRSPAAPATTRSMAAEGRTS